MTLAANWGSGLFKLLLGLLPDWLQAVVVWTGLAVLAAVAVRWLWRVLSASRPGSTGSARPGDPGDPDVR